MNHERITAYLLNELTETEAEQFEEECFALPEWPKAELASAEYERIHAEHDLLQAELQSAEYDLIQAYIQNKLSPERRRRFEENYLTTSARKERVLLTEASLRFFRRTWWERLLDFLKSLIWEPQALVLVPRFAAILLTVGLGAVLVWYVIPPRAPQTFAHLNLVSTSDERNTNERVLEVELPLPQDALRLSLELPESPSPGTSYRVQWRNVKGPIKDLDIEKQEANSISVIILADELKHGQYVLKLFRKNPDGTEKRTANYFFDVVE